MKHLLPETTEHKKVTESSQHGFVQEKLWSCSRTGQGTTGWESALQKKTRGFR